MYQEGRLGGPEADPWGAPYLTVDHEGAWPHKHKLQLNQNNKNPIPASPSKSKTEQEKNKCMKKQKKMTKQQRRGSEGKREIKMCRAWRDKGEWEGWRVRVWGRRIKIGRGEEETWKDEKTETGGRKLKRKENNLKIERNKRFTTASPHVGFRVFADYGAT